MSVHDRELPPGWTVLDASGPGPFVTRARLRRPDGTEVEWTSRRHRKRLGVRSLAGVETSAAAQVWSRRPTVRSWTIGLLFMIGSLCFALGSMPLYFDRVSPAVTAWTFFVGSVFFTSASFLQYHEAVNAPALPEGGRSPRHGLRRYLAWTPRRIDYWATLVQLVGTVFFNVTTFAATRSDLTLAQERHLVWAPDVLGSICFLVASWFAYLEVAPRLRHPRGGRSTGWWIAALNLLGSIAFGISAVAARVVAGPDEVANLALVNLGTWIGAVCFFVGAALLPVESAHDAEPEAPPAADGAVSRAA